MRLSYHRPYKWSYRKQYKWPKNNGSTYPRENLLLWWDDGTSKIGDHDGSVQLLQSGLFAAGDYLTGDIADGTTVVSSEGDGTIALSENQLDYTDDKTLYSFVLSNGSQYEYPTYIDSETAVWLDVSGNNRHLYLANDTAVDATSHCVESISVGSDWLNQMGWTVADGEQYFDENLTEMIPVDTIIPALADGSGDCSYWWAPLYSVDIEDRRLITELVSTNISDWTLTYESEFTFNAGKFIFSTAGTPTPKAKLLDVIEEGKTYQWEFAVSYIEDFGNIYLFIGGTHATHTGVAGSFSGELTSSSAGNIELWGGGAVVTGSVELTLSVKEV